MLKEVEAQVYFSAIQELSASERLTIHSFGTDYPAYVVRQKASGAAVVKYTTGSGKTREVTCKLDPSQPLGFARLTADVPGARG